MIPPFAGSLWEKTLHTAKTAFPEGTGGFLILYYYYSCSSCVL